MQYTDIKNIVYSNKEKTSYDCEVFFIKFNTYLPYTATSDDPEEHGKRIYNDIISKKYGCPRDFVDNFDYVQHNINNKNSILFKIKEKISIWQTEMALNIIDDKDRKSLINWLKYAKDIKSIDINQKEIKWPKSPE